MKRLKDNAMLIILCIVMICCTVFVNKKIDEINWELWSMNYKMDNLPTYNLWSDIYRQIDYIQSDLDSIYTDVNNIKQDIDDIWYKLGI